MDKDSYAYSDFNNEEDGKTNISKMEADSRTERKHRLFPAGKDPCETEEGLYVVYEYTDYNKEFSSKILRVYKNLDSAIEYAERKCVHESEDRGVEYVCQSTAGRNFDRKKTRPPYTRIGVSGVRYYAD